MISTRMAERTSTKWARLLGETAAYVQDGVDWACDMGCKALKKVGDAHNDTRKEPSNSYARAAVRFGRGMVRFVGEIGETYYRTYEKLKQKNR